MPTITRIPDPNKICLHCVISQLIHEHVADDVYTLPEMVHAMTEIMLDMIAHADSNQEYYKLFTAASIRINEGVKDILHGRYKCKHSLDATQGNA